MPQTMYTNLFIDFCFSQSIFENELLHIRRATQIPYQRYFV